MAKSNLAVRLLTAALVSPLLLLLLFRGPHLGWYALVFVATGISAFETFAMSHPEDRVARVLGTLATLLVSAGLYFFGQDARAWLTILLAIVMLQALFPLWRLGDIQTAALRMMAGIAIPLYVGGLLCTLALLRRDAGAHGSYWVLLCLFYGWLADTGGYFFGRYFGKTKLYEAVSPKKTRAGFVGSLVGAECGSLITHFLLLPTFPLGDAIVLGAVCGALGQLGDLAESLLKRSTGIKDSGQIVPGHGGMLDRIDALLVVSPTVYLYALWTGHIGTP